MKIVGVAAVLAPMNFSVPIISALLGGFVVWEKVVLAVRGGRRVCGGV
jgi:hypothetical protein